MWTMRKSGDSCRNADKNTRVTNSAFEVFAAVVFSVFGIRFLLTQVTIICELGSNFGPQMLFRHRDRGD